MFQMQNCLEQWRQQKNVRPPLTENLVQNRKESHCKADFCWPTRSYLRQCRWLQWGCHFIDLTETAFKAADRHYCQTELWKRSVCQSLIILFQQHSIITKVSVAYSFLLLSLPGQKQMRISYKYNT